jgi:histidine ammonia-lyase
MGKTEMSAGKRHFFDGETLTLYRLVELGGGGFQWDLTPTAWDRVREGRRIVEDAVVDGADYYGVNTGVGSQKDFGVSAADFAHFNDHVIVGEATNMPGPAFDPKVVRAALAVLINNVATGRLGVRAELVERLLRLSRCAQMPEVRKNTSSGMADLTPLAQLALPLVGRSLDGSPPLIERPYDLAAKEAVSLINCNAFSIAHGAFVLEEARRLIATFDLATAPTFEALRANLSYYRPESLAGYRNPHQITSCQRIAGALEGSSPWAPSEWRFLQDPLSFRFAMRVNGSAEASLEAAQRAYFDDLNCVCDNPLVSLDKARSSPGSTWIPRR